MGDLKVRRSSDAAHEEIYEQRRVGGLPEVSREAKTASSMSGERAQILPGFRAGSGARFKIESSFGAGQSCRAPWHSRSISDWDLSFNSMGQQVRLLTAARRKRRNGSRIRTDIARGF